MKTLLKILLIIFCVLICTGCYTELQIQTVDSTQSIYYDPDIYLGSRVQLYYHTRVPYYWKYGNRFYYLNHNKTFKYNIKPKLDNRSKNNNLRNNDGSRKERKR